MAPFKHEKVMFPSTSQSVTLATVSHEVFIEAPCGLSTEAPTSPWLEYGAQVCVYSTGFPSALQEKVCVCVRVCMRVCVGAEIHRYGVLLQLSHSYLEWAMRT